MLWLRWLWWFRSNAAFHEKLAPHAVCIPDVLVRLLEHIVVQFVVCEGQDLEEGTVQQIFHFLDDDRYVLAVLVITKVVVGTCFPACFSGISKGFREWRFRGASWGYQR